MAQEGEGMVAIPDDTPATVEDVNRWYALQAEIARLMPTKLIAQEKVLRARIARSTLLFPNPKEGTNDFKLGNGWVLKYTNGIKRDVDYAQFQALVPVFTEKGIAAAACLRQKWELEKKVYNTLTAEQKLLFDQCLNIKPESPKLEVVLPAAEAKKQEAIAALAQAQATGTMPNPPLGGLQL